MANYCKTIFGEALQTEPLDKYPVSTLLQHGSQITFCDKLDKGLFCFPVGLSRAMESNCISMSINGKVQISSLASFLSLLDMTLKGSCIRSYHQPTSFRLLPDVCVCVVWRGVHVFVFPRQIEDIFNNLK